MSGSKDSQDHIAAIAAESLDTFAKVAETAKSHLSHESPTSAIHPTAFANAWSSPDVAWNAASNLARIHSTNVQAYRTLCREPAIARVVVAERNGTNTIYYFCRTTPVSMGDCGINLASYLSPIGRLAALPVGENHALRLPNRTNTVKILESGRFQPTLVDREWDSRNSVLEGETYGPWTIESLLKLTRDHLQIDEELLDRLLKEESEAGNVLEGIRRSVITKMDLRDQPILDQYQDEIFRLPLNSKLLILGAPGTGKTTTLIRRLGQKLDSNFLDKDERQAVHAGMFVEEDDRTPSWIMFTPTELLKLYVKEAFNRESIPASDAHISTWADCRDDLARNKFRILRSATRSSPLVMKDTVSTLKVETKSDQIVWFSDFDKYQKTEFLEDIHVSARNLSKSQKSDVSNLGNKILVILDASDSTPRPSVFASLMRMANEIRNAVENMQKSTDQEIRGALNLQVNRDKKFLDVMATFIESLSELNGEAEDQEPDEEEDTDQLQIGRAAALSHYMRAVRAKARARARKRNVSKTSLAGRLIEWLGDRSLSDPDLQKVGENLVIQSALRQFANPVRRYIGGITARYRRFRRTRQAEGLWYPADGFRSTDIHPLEVDIVLLATMRCIDELVVGAPGLVNIESPASSTLERLTRQYRTQVLVDEATDFSPIQLACMTTLARPRTRSFFCVRRLQPARNRLGDPFN